MLLIAGMRQASLVVAHLIYEIPMNYVALLEWMNIKLYNYGELNTKSIVKSTLLDIKKGKNKIIFTLQGLLMQDEYPIIKSTGNLIMITSGFADRIRHKKRTLEEVRRKVDE